MVLILNAFLFAQAETTLSDIKTSLICTCECNMTVAACEGTMTCGTSAKLTSEAKDLMKKGLSKAQILDATLRWIKKNKRKNNSRRYKRIIT